jgi:integrase
MKPALRLVTPSTDNRSVATMQAPGRSENETYRAREYLTPDEVDRLIETAKRGRHGHRNATLILIAWRHGLRAQEICELQWSSVEFGRNPSVHIKRVKGSISGRHHLKGDEVRWLRELQRQYPNSAYVFTTERGKKDEPFTPDAINRLIKRIGQRAKFPFPVHVHMLRHACGYGMADDGEDLRVIQAWLGHAQVANSVRYTQLAPKRLAHVWSKAKMY